MATEPLVGRRSDHKVRGTECIVCGPLACNGAPVRWQHAARSISNLIKNANCPELAYSRSRVVILPLVCAADVVRRPRESGRHAYDILGLSYDRE